VTDQATCRKVSGHKWSSTREIKDSMKVPELMSRFPPTGLGIWSDSYCAEGETGVIRIMVRGHGGMSEAGVDLCGA